MIGEGKPFEMNWRTKYDLLSMENKKLESKYKEAQDDIREFVALVSIVANHAREEDGHPLPTLEKHINRLKEKYIEIKTNKEG